MQQRMKSAKGKKIQQNSQEIEVIEKEVRRMLKGLWPIKFQSIFLIFIFVRVHTFSLLYSFSSVRFCAIFHYFYHPLLLRVFRFHMAFHLNVDAYRTAITLFQKDEQMQTVPV